VIQLRPGQQEVAEYRGGYMAVPAVPGAGKTTVLAHLAADLIKEGKPKPGKILIVTVMNSAVANFRSRIGDFLEQRGLARSKGYEVKTLHSLAMNILKEKPEILLINDAFQILDETRQDAVIREVTAKWLRGNAERWQSVLKLTQQKDKQWYQKALGNWEQKDLPKFFKEAVSYVKSQGIDSETGKTLLGELPTTSYLAWALEVAELYSEVLRSNGMLDFDDLISQALRLLQEDPGVLNRLQRRWTYVFEDEAQDSNPLQEKILRLLAGDNLVRVGDSNQAIMGTFTSAEPEFFRSFCRESDVSKQSILISSRSSRQVIDLANYLVNWVREEHPQVECRTALEEQYVNPVGAEDLFPNPTVEGYTLAVKKFATYDEEIAGVARLAQLQAEKRPENTLAILVPTRSLQTELASKLNELGARFMEVGKVPDEQVRTILDVKVVIDYLAQPHRVEGLLQVLRQVLMQDLPEEGLRGLKSLFTQYRLEEILFPIGGVLPWVHFPDELWDRELYSLFIEALSRIKLWLNASVNLAPEDLVLFIAEDLQLIGEQLEIANNLALLIKQQVSEHPNWKLIDIARDLPRLETSLRQFAKILYEQKGFVPKPGVITLLTAHKSKGLEWDTVYLLGVTSAEYPSTVKDKFRSDLWYLYEERCNPIALAKAELKLHLGGDQNANPVEKAKLEEIAERLRLLYVAVTRARKNLLITYHETGLYNKRVGPSLPLVALGKYMAEEGKRYVTQQA
jgi:DNA helicase II / ATP-dependent DNA helicase PcrA